MSKQYSNNKLKGFSFLLMSLVFSNSLVIACGKIESSPSKERGNNASTRPASQNNGEKTNPQQKQDRQGKSVDGDLTKNENGIPVRIANDEIYKSTLAKLNGLSTEEKKVSLQKAKAINFIDANIDGEDVVIEITFGDKTSEQLIGKMKDNKAIFSNKSHTISGELMAEEKSTGNKINTYVLNIKFGLKQEKKKRATVSVIVRKIFADLKVVKKELDQPDEAVKSLVELFENGLNSQAKNNSLRQVYFETLEVVNGITAGRISMITNDDQVLGFRGQLVKRDEKTDVTVSSLEKSIRTQSVKEVTEKNQMQQSNMQNLIELAQIVKITEGNSFVVDLSLKPNAEKKVQTIQIQLDRKIEIKN